MPTAKKPKPYARTLLASIARLGVREPFVRRLALPEWWDDEIADTPAGRDELHLLLSQLLGLDAGSLRDGRPRFMPLPHSKLKTAKGLTAADIEVARRLGVQIARLVALGVTSRLGVPTDAAAVRNHILRAAPWVDLKGLLALCWSVGIPVVHIAEWPAQCKRMAALVASIAGRPVIVLTDRHKQSAWLLFHLAHELGHVVCGHVPSGEVLVDAEVDKESKNAEEVQANRFAIELLTGSAKTRVLAGERLPKAHELACNAREHGARHGIDPGHFVLNYADSMGTTFWGVANAALKEIDPDGDAPALVRQKLNEHLDWSRLPATSAGFVQRVIGAESQPA